MALPHAERMEDAAGLERLRRFSVDEYEQMHDAGIVSADERLELILGEIVEMAAQGNPHVVAVELGKRALEAAFGEGFWVRAQAPLRLPGVLSKPEPDLAVVQGSPRDFLDHRNPHHQPSSALLVVEVSDATLALDRGPKSLVYAGAGIADYWIVNLVEGLVEVRRSPRKGTRGATYRSVRKLDRTAAIAPLALPGASVRVADLLP
jgi:Uma2 family endonuclease